MTPSMIAIILAAICGIVVKLHLFDENLLKFCLYAGQFFLSEKIFPFCKWFGMYITTLCKLIPASPLVFDSSSGVLSLVTAICRKVLIGQREYTVKYGEYFSWH